MEDPDRVTIVSRGPEETQAIGKVLGANAKPGDVFLLVGELGAGKTCLTQGILWGLGAEEYARSPTFVLVSQYRGRLMLYHIDVYRMDAIGEIADLGLDEYLFGEGVCVVAWAEKAPSVFPEHNLTVQIEYPEETGEETTRRLTLTAAGPGYVEMMRAVRSAMVKI